MEDFHIIQFEGIGTHWWIKLPKDTSNVIISTIHTQLLLILEEFDNKYSRFKDQSLINKLNNEKVLEDFPEELYNMLIQSEKVKELTDGRFNVCVGTHLENLGYDKNYSFESLAKVNSEKLKILELSKERIRISEKARIDLGGIGKGWLIDKFRKFLMEYNLNSFIINGGGDIYVYDIANEGYEFALENPFDNTQMVGTIKISNEAIACSSPSRRIWTDKRSGKVNHHLIDFNSGESTNKIISVFTQGKSIVGSDLASTAIFISDINQLVKIATALEVEYLIIFPNKEFKMSKGYKGILNS